MKKIIMYLLLLFVCSSCGINRTEMIEYQVHLVYNLTNTSTGEVQQLEHYHVMATKASCPLYYKVGPGAQISVTSYSAGYHICCKVKDPAYTANVVSFTCDTIRTYMINPLGEEVQ